MSHRGSSLNNGPVRGTAGDSEKKSAGMRGLVKKTSCTVLYQEEEETSTNRSHIITINR